MNTKITRITFQFNVGTVHFHPTEKAGIYEFACLDESGQAITGGTTSKFANKSNAKDLLEEALMLEDSSNA